MKIQVYCTVCNDQIEHDPPAEMIGSDKMYENDEAKTQSRDYECPTCKNSVNVVINGVSK